MRAVHRPNVCPGLLEFENSTFTLQPEVQPTSSIVSSSSLLYCRGVRFTTSSRSSFWNPPFSFIVSTVGTIVSDLDSRLLSIQISLILTTDFDIKLCQIDNRWFRLLVGVFACPPEYALVMKHRENFKYTPQTSAIYRFAHLFFIITNLPIPSTENPPKVATTTKAQWVSG